METRQQYVLFVLIAAVVALSNKASGGRFDPDKVKPLGEPPSSVLTAEEYMAHYGYTGKRYEAVTEDGYILTLCRIVKNNGPPVLFVNGLSLGPELWVMHGPGHDLAFILADLGYDVWLGYQRGLTGSTDHLWLDSTQPEFWDFSHDESGYYDIPAMINLILGETGHSQLYYVGSSHGGTLFMVMCSERPEYCSAVAGNVQFAPAMWIPQWEQLPGSIKFSLFFMKLHLYLLREINSHQLLYRTELYTASMKYGCGSFIGEEPCFLSLQLVTGFHKKNMASGWLGHTLALTSSGTSRRTVDHLVKLTNIGGAKKYDWGPEKNRIVYGSEEPPSYNLSRITSPTALYYSESDALVSLPAMLKTMEQLGNLRYAEAVSDPTYGHAEMIFGKDLHKLVFPGVVDFFDSLSGLH